MRKDSTWYEQKIAQEERKIQALEARRTSPDATPYKSQGTMIDFLVPAFFDPGDTYYMVSDRQETLQLICGGTNAAALGKIGCKELGADIGTAAKVPSKYNTGKYPKVLIVTGGTPDRKTTEWGSTWLKKWAKDTDGQSHRLMPFGFNPTATSPSFEDVYEYFLLQFGMGGELRSKIANGGSASLIVGKNEVIESISG
ncbi:hypothetical protein [Dapis sp. BLCC M172]|uniref:hypothetical protein n=1 Tax=Dapis sp. BLCC M172 TaxID=2975281 RepID=UPI003CEF8E27